MTQASPSKCRCGWDGQEPHPCHFDGYSCRKPAKEYFYEPTIRYALAGVQGKASVVNTWACEEHWKIFSERLAQHHEAERLAMQKIVAELRGGPDAR